MRVIRAEQLMRSAGEGNSALERRCTYAAACQIAGICMELRTDNPEVASLFALRYADHPAAQPPNFAYYVAEVRGGYAFWCGHAPAWRWSQGPLPPDAVVFLADSVAMAALVRYDAHMSSLQAAAVEFNGIAAAIAGSSASAKASTLLAAVRRGMHLYSDERTILYENTVHPFLRRSSVRSAGARLLLSDTPAQGYAEAVKPAPELSLKTCFGGAAIAAPKPLRALFVLAGAGHCAALEAIDTAVALPAISRWFDARGDMVDRVGKAVAALKGVKCYRLTLGTPDENASALAYALARIAR
jgi:hypothetical protein